MQDVHEQLCRLKAGVRVLAFVAPLARAAGSESLTALYARTFERAAFGFAKVRPPHCQGAAAGAQLLQTC